MARTFSFPYFPVKFLFLFGSSLLVAGAAHAQLGVQAGANLTSLRELFSRNSFPTTSLARVGYQVGVSYEQPLGTHWAVVPQLQFSRESQQLRKEGFGFSTYPLPNGEYLIHDYQLSCSYLNLPVLLRRYLGPAYVEAGPQVSLLLGGRVVGETRSVGTYVTHQPIDQAATAAYHRLEAAACVGVGVRLPAGWQAGVRAYWGSMRTRPDDPKDYQYSPEAMPISGTQYRRTVQVLLTRQLWPKKA